MNLLRIASRVSIEDHTSFSPLLLSYVTEDMRNEMGVEPSTEPYKSGKNSVVFTNSNNNIVVFSDWDGAYATAEEAKSSGTDVLPKIFDIKEYHLDNKTTDDEFKEVLKKSCVCR